jgi:beta-glucosidase
VMPLYGGLPQASQIDTLLQPDTFLWATGIEDTFIIEPSKRTGRILDEYALTGHYDRWREDIGLMATLGVPCARYGVPWYRVQPTPDTWDWAWADQTLELMLESGVEPIVDLVHYGVPAWLNGALLDADFPFRMAEYGARVADRYKGRLRWYTPLNEPRINAWYAGMLGWWPPHKRGWKGFSHVLVSLARAVCLTHRALKEVHPEIVCLHVDPADLYFTNDSSLQDEVDLRQEIVFLALDLISGRVDRDHKLWPWLMAHGHEHDDIERFLAIGVGPDVVGVNCYPLFGQKEVLRSGSKIVMRNRYADGGLLETLVKQYWERYRRPLVITETASLEKRRLEWMKQSVDAVRNLREGGVPVVGYTWWPMFSLVSWGYQHGNKPLEDYMVHLGMWDLDSKLNRIETPVAQSYRKLIESGSSAVGELRMDPKEVADFAVR